MCDEVALNIIDERVCEARILCNVMEDEDTEEWSEVTGFSMRLNVREE